ncbi:MAG: sigma-54-dependent Fis family transcriptional regulator [Deltaproteobacteria bacterium]|nr:sigma-54-dependent Fis family transcriptional regulator [Deltaproteobacteria bacterium]
MVVHSNSKNFIGKSKPILEILALVDKIAPTTSTVLILGESGTGKELIARQLHLKSNRAAMPFVTLNCGNLQESLLESELFGHEKGSYTGANAKKIGLCEIASGGSLFLDEIGELSLGIQSKLLRFLQNGEFYRVGGKHPIHVNVRVISATHRDLEGQIKEEKFREDLFYRLNTITLKIPPLRDRTADIPILVEYFLNKTGQEKVFQIDPPVLELFAHYPWPGNIRELENIIERMKILTEGNTLSLDDVPIEIRTPTLQQMKIKKLDLELTLDEIEKNHILRVLTHCQGNKAQTARNLKITLKTLYNKLHNYGMLKSTRETQDFLLKRSQL